MPYWFGLFGIMIGLISPAIAVLFVVPTSAKTLTIDSQKSIQFFIAWVFICGMFFWLDFTNKVHTLDLIIGAGASCLLLFYLINRKQELGFIFMALFTMNTLYVWLRQLLFSDFMISRYNQSAVEAKMVISSRFPEQSEHYLIFSEMVDLSVKFYSLYSPGVWLSVMMLCLGIGYFLCFRKNEDMPGINDYQTHIYVLYGLVVALVLAIFTRYKVYGINFLIGLAPLYLLQGIGVISVRMGQWFQRYIILRVIGILCLVFNPYIALFISLIGLFDNFFDFRSLHKTEEINEDNSN
jgi:hypothetical protein